ncbi:MAG: TonB-dependent receptor, partial [Bacteroidota bacterium]
RVQWKGLFAQAFYTNNNGGNENRPTLLYQTGNRSPVGRQQIEAQVQYNFGIPQALDADITVGADYRRAINETFNLVYGRNENDDAYRIAGGYAQAKFALIDQLDLLVAGRYDVFNFIDDGFFSPRVALVFKPDPQHTFRASFNRAGSPATGLEYYIDFPVNAPVPGVFDFWLAGQSELHEFPDATMEFLNPNVIAAGAGLDPSDPAIAGIIASLPQYQFGVDQGLGLDYIYTLLNAGANGADDQIIAGLEADPTTAPLAPLIAAYLSDPANTPTGSTGTFFGVNAFDGNAPLNELIPTNESTIRTSNTFEIGYKGLIANKLSLAVDIYNTSTKGFSDFTQIAPLITLANPDVSGDISAAVTADLTSFLIENGLPESVAAPLAQGVGAGYATAADVSGLSALLPAFYSTGTVESTRVPQDDGILHVASGYRIFPDAELSYWGADISAQYYFRDDLSAFANYSWVSETQFDGEDLVGDADSPLNFSLNTPQNKFRLGVIYGPLTGFRGQISYQHDQSFFSNTGEFGGDTDTRNLVDMSVGYAFDEDSPLSGLAIDVSGTNIFDNEFRAFPNMPLIGRRVIGRLTYTFGDK